VFLAGVGLFAWFMAGLWRGWSFERVGEPEPVTGDGRFAPYRIG
jgi:hypothetical protein